MTPKRNDIVCIGVSFHSGANRDGAQYAPIWLNDHIAQPFDIMLLLHTEDVQLMDDTTIGIKNYEAVLQMRKEVMSEVAVVAGTGKRVVTIGGDHSIAIGSIAGMLEHYPNIGVIWFDAHTDINTETTSPSGNAHGMPLAALLGLCASEINTPGTKLNPKNVYWVGVRDIDAGEWDIIHRLGIETNVYTAEQVHQLGMEKIMSQIRVSLNENGVEQLHLSFDVDGMDSLIVPATGTPVEKGLNEVDLNVFVEKMAIMPQLVSVDFVEYNPLLDDAQYLTGKWCLQTLEKLMMIFD